MNSLWWTNRQIKKAWNAESFEPSNGASAQQFFNLNTVTVLEPARKQMNEKRSDCVVWMDGRTRTQ